MKRGNKKSRIKPLLLSFLIGIIAGIYISPYIMGFIKDRGLLEPDLREIKSSTTKKSVGKAYVVQLAAFEDIESALGLLDTLNTKGYFAYIQTGTDFNNNLYLVRIGLWKSEKEAKAFANKFEKREEMRVLVLPVNN
ncbi:MAG: hypothetical protein KatS3mg078_2363 [Deltaproteobacteria bacterium]|nr:MAG: hypothetical protein KatS3mg078_2363 [Deltaproteobacteria bacterium]